MKSIVYLSIALLLVGSTTQAENQRILRRVIKSTPTATNLGRIRQVTVRSVESGGVTEITSKEAASFGQRSANETSTQQASAQAGTKSRPAQPASTSTSTSTSTTTSPSTTTTTTTSSTTAAPSSTSAKPILVEQRKHKASDRQQASAEVELLSGAPSSWQTMTAVEAPAAMLIATGTRAAASSDLSSSASSHEETSDFLRASSSVKGGASHSVGETFSRIRQQHQQHQQTVRQQNYFRPAASKTAPVQATKTHWYQTTSTTPRPAPLVQQQEQHYEQQNEQYVEQQQQQQQVEYGAAPAGQAEPFAFDFKTEDQRGNGQYRKEESDQNGVVRGSYGYTDANGIYRHVEYVADHNGFRANIKSNEPGMNGETQPASIQLASAIAPAPKETSASAQYVEQGENWQGNKQASADLALAPPDFESSHKSERLPRHYRY